MRKSLINIIAVLAGIIVTGGFMVIDGWQKRQERLLILESENIKNQDLQFIKYINDKDYFRFTSALLTEKNEYKAGEKVVFSFTRIAENGITEAEGIKSLILVSEDGQNIKLNYESQIKKDSIPSNSEGEFKVYSQFVLPKDLKNGNYKILFSLQYSVSGVLKSVEAYTNEFKVQ